jgi:hypothetical protein
MSNDFPAVRKTSRNASVFRISGCGLATVGQVLLLLACSSGGGDGNGISCAADGVCHSECASDPDCSEGPKTGTGGAGGNDAATSTSTGGANNGRDAATSTSTGGSSTTGSCPGPGNARNYVTLFCDRKLSECSLADRDACCAEYIDRLLASPPCEDEHKALWTCLTRTPDTYCVDSNLLRVTGTECESLADTRDSCLGNNGSGSSNACSNCVDACRGIQGCSCCRECNSGCFN